MGARRFSLYDIEQFIREAGAERITEDAVTGLEKEIEKLAEEITNKAMKYAEHAGRRKLIRSSDVLLTNKSDLFAYHSSPANLSAKASTTHAASKTEM